MKTMDAINMTSELRKKYIEDATDILRDIWGTSLDLNETQETALNDNINSLIELKKIL